jgi:hypothetical protein
VTDWYDPGYNMGGAPMAAPAAGVAGGSGANWWAGTTGAGLSGFGTILSFTSSIMAANQAKKAANYNAQVAERNAQAAADAAEIEAQQHQRNATNALNDIVLVKQAQAYQEEQQRDRQEYVAGQTRAIVAASGLLMRGSPLATYEMNLQQSEKQILAGRYKAELQERALRDQATMEGYAADVSRYGAGERLRIGKGQAALAGWEGTQRAAASRLGAFGSLISGGARTYATYEREQATGRKGRGGAVDPGY